VTVLEYELSIGLETHIELSTNSKVFCSCPSKYGGKPNTRCCPVCTGMPGTLPVLNSKVIDYAIMAGLSLNCNINLNSYMARKNYVYPDLAKGYQITQGDVPLCSDGYVEIDQRKIRIERIHIEEDAGKLIRENDKILVDYNRAGVPLIEIVTRPDFTSPNEVREYLEYLRLTMKYLGISDCKMQEASMRCDVNISVREKGSLTLGTKCEIKNINSVNYICKAIESEFSRQCSIIESGQKVKSATLRYNENLGKIEVMRYKETSADYRYFAEPDILPIVLEEEYIRKIKSAMPVLPKERKDKFKEKYNLPSQYINQIIKYKKCADFFEELVSYTSDVMLSADVILSSIYMLLPTEEDREEFLLPFNARDVYVVIDLIKSKKIAKHNLKSIIENMYKNKKTFFEIYTLEDFKSINKEELMNICLSVIDSNPKIVSDYLSGKQKAISALIGNVMKLTKGKSDTNELISMLKEILEKY